MSNVQSYANFSDGKNCLVCNSSANVSSMAVRLNDLSYVGPVCNGKACRYSMKKDTNGVATAALGDSKLLQTHFLKESNAGL